MRTFLFILCGVIVALIAYWGITFYLTVQVSKRLIDAAVPFEKRTEDASVSMLVLGDSTAVGVGASSSKETVAGRVSEYLGATSVENYAVSGAVTDDLPSQIEKAELPRYRLIVIQVGGNDIIRFRKTEEAVENLRAAIAMLPPADKVVIIAPGDVGGATLFPFFVRPFHTKRNYAYHAAFARLAEETGTTYVNFGDAPATKTINEHPETYLAADGLHPSSAGYGLWFDTIRPSI